MTNIWSLRFTPARGNHWVLERDSLPENVQSWLAVLRKDEPNVTFIASKRKPSIAKAA